MPQQTDPAEGSDRELLDRSGTLHMIGNAHLDPVWLWRWQDGFQEAKATFRSALDRMHDDDGFLFTSSSAALYEFVERNDPAMFEEIRSRVREGRWEIVGGWWIQPDCNLPSGESFVRQGLYGQRYFKEKLGVTATVGYNVDSFGHAGSLPQILRKSGMDAYVFMRPQPHEQRLPSRLFSWRSDDGSEVLAFRIPFEYCTWGHHLQQHIVKCASEFRPGLDALMCFYGVGNHGGGPTRENLASIRAIQSERTGPHLVFSTPSRYFAAMRAAGVQPPVVQDEFQHHASGCYSAHSGIKRWNRKAEHRLLVAETLAALARLEANQRYPRDAFTSAWKDVLFNQFHDILAGTSIAPAYDDARNSYGHALTTADREINNALQAISWQVNIPAEEGSRPIVVFNPHSWHVHTEVQLEFAKVRDGDVLVDSNDVPVPLQVVRSAATVSSDSRMRLSWIADVPALGYTTYRVVPHPRTVAFSGIIADATTLENEWYRLVVDRSSGALSSLYDKTLHFEWLRGPAARAVVIDDPSDTWSHGVLRFDRVVGEFSARSTRLVEHGPVKSVIRVVSTFRGSTLTQDFTLYRDVARIDVHVTVDWHEQFKMLKLKFPLNLFSVTATYETPYGTIQRPTNGEEEPGQSWVDFTGVARGDGRLLGMSVLNDGKYSFDMNEHEINLTVLRSPIYAHHDPYIPEADGEYAFIDQGMQHFSYTLLPHAGSWQTAGTVQRAAELNTPLVVIPESCHRGPLAQRTSYLELDTDQVIVTAFKEAEDGDALIIRCFETTGRPVTAVIRLSRFDRTIDTQFGPGELKTLKVPYDPALPVREVNLLEWDQ